MQKIGMYSACVCGGGGRGVIEREYLARTPEDRYVQSVCVCGGVIEREYLARTPEDRYIQCVCGGGGL